MKIVHIILHIFLYTLLLALLGLFFIALLKCFLGGPYFTLFIRYYVISDDG